MILVPVIFKPRHSETMFLGEESKQSSHVDWIIRDGARQLL